MCKIGCRNWPRHLCAGLAGGEDWIGLCFLLLRKRLLARVLGHSTQHSHESSLNSHSNQLPRACGTCFKYPFTTSLPTQLTTFISSSSNALNIFLNSRALLGYQTACSDSFTIYLYSSTQQTCVGHLLCAS